MRVNSNFFVEYLCSLTLTLLKHNSSLVRKIKFRGKLYSSYLARNTGVSNHILCFFFFHFPFRRYFLRYEKNTSSLLTLRWRILRSSSTMQNPAHQRGQSNRPEQFHPLFFYFFFVNNHFICWWHERKNVEIKVVGNFISYIHICLWQFYRRTNTYPVLGRAERFGRKRI